MMLNLIQLFVNYMCKFEVPNQIKSEEDLKQLYEIVNEVPILDNNLWLLSKSVLHLCTKNNVDGFKFLGNEKDITNIDKLYQSELNLIKGWLSNGN
nr:MAG TPA: hypothetical protein [Caudoviricetes sp.]